jgi:hypothetical protein
MLDYTFAAEEYLQELQPSFCGHVPSDLALIPGEATSASGLGRVQQVLLDFMCVYILSSYIHVLERNDT